MRALLSHVEQESCDQLFDSKPHNNRYTQCLESTQHTQTTHITYTPGVQNGLSFLHHNLELAAIQVGLATVSMRVHKLLLDFILAALVRDVSTKGGTRKSYLVVKVREGGKERKKQQQMSIKLATSDLMEPSLAP